MTLVNDGQGKAGTVESAAWVYFSGPSLGFQSDGTSATAQLPAVSVPLDEQSQAFLFGAVEVHPLMGPLSGCCSIPPC